MRLPNQYTIEHINRIKPKNSIVTAIRHDGKHFTPKGASYTRIICKCNCGIIFRTLLSSVTQGKSLSCGCLQRKYAKSQARNISWMNLNKPKSSRLTAIKKMKPHITKGGQAVKRIKAACQCGNQVTVRQGDFMNGHTKSCGCYVTQMLLKRNTKYTHNIPELYQCHHSMIRRCYDKKNLAYERYGGRGVRVCDEWKNNYQAFLTWALSNGWKSGLQIDKDILGNGILYSPSTCCFVTLTTNLQNTRRNVRVMYNGEFLCITEIARRVGCDSQLFISRFKKYGLQKAIEYKNKKLNKWITKQWERQSL